MICVLDASAVLAILFDERGADAAIGFSRGAMISAVNMTEVLEKFSAKRDDSEAASVAVRRLEITVEPFDSRQARIAADLKPRFAGKDISLADRACMALALDRQASVVTADRAWIDLDVDFDIRMIR